MQRWCSRVSTDMTMISDLCWVDGRAADAVAVSNRGLQYGDGVFETVRVDSGQMTLETFHYRRLFTSCDLLRIPVDDGLLSRQVAAFLAGRGDGILKILVTRGSGGRGYNPDGACGCQILYWFPLPQYPETWAANGVVVRLCATKLGHSPALAGLKHMNRLEQVLARSEWQQPDIAEGLVCDIAGHLIEGTMTNLFLVKQGRILTADLSLSGVNGVMRQWLLEKSSFASGVSIQSLTIDDFWQAEEVFLTNSVIGVWPVRQCGEHFWKPGSITRQVQQEVNEVFHG